MINVSGESRQPSRFVRFRLRLADELGLFHRVRQFPVFRLREQEGQRTGYERYDPEQHDRHVLTGIDGLRARRHRRFYSMSGFVTKG